MGTSRLAKHLLQDGILTNKDIAFYERNSSNVGPGFARILIAAGIFTEETLAQYLASITWFPLLQLNTFHIPSELRGLIDRPLMEAFTVVPYEMHQRKLTLLIADPLDQATLLQLKFFIKFQLNYKIATFSCIQEAIQDQYPDYVFSPAPLEKFLIRQASAPKVQAEESHPITLPEAPSLSPPPPEPEPEPAQSDAPETPAVPDEHPLSDEAPLEAVAAEPEAPPPPSIEESLTPDPEPLAPEVEQTPDTVEEDTDTADEAIPPTEPAQPDPSPMEEEAPLLVLNENEPALTEEIPEITLMSEDLPLEMIPEVTVNDLSTPVREPEPASQVSSPQTKSQEALPKALQVLGATLARLNLSSSLDKSLAIAKEGFEKAGSPTGWILDLTTEDPRSLTGWGGIEFNAMDVLLDLKHGAKSNFWIPVSAILPADHTQFPAGEEIFHTLISSKEEKSLLVISAWPEDLATQTKFVSLSSQVMRSLLQQNLRVGSRATPKPAESDTVLV